MAALLHWLIEQRSVVAAGIALVFFLITLVLRYGYDLWWPAGIVAATVCGLVAVFGGGRG